MIVSTKLTLEHKLPVVYRPKKKIANDQNIAVKGLK